MNSPIFRQPNEGDYPEYYRQYISLVPGDDVIAYFINQEYSLASILRSLAHDKLHYRYAVGKWTIADIAQHLLDTERIFCYRLLTFARADSTEIPGFEEDDYAQCVDTSLRTTDDIIAEYHSLRASTLSLLRSLDSEAIERSGIANGGRVSVRAITYMIAGHELHHLGVIQERYL